MAVLYNLPPLAAMELFYDGEKRGVWEGDFIRNEKERGLTVPPMLREFLENYGYLEINGGGEGRFKLFHPDGMGGVVLNDDEEGEIHLLVVGELGGMWIALRMDECDYLRIVFGERSDEGTMWTPTDNGTLEGILTVMFCSQLFGAADSFVFENDIEIDAVLKNVDRSLITPSEGNAQHISICFDDESGSFLAAEFDPDCERITMLHVVPRKTYEQRKAEKYATISLDELKTLFDGEFFTNALHCDFSHALELKLEIIKRLEQAGTGELELCDHYKQAGRCLWALGRLDEAAEQYAEAGAIARKSGDAAKLAEYYHTMGNFYADTKQWDKSDEMYEAELAVRREHFPDDVYHIGMVYHSRAQFLDGAGGDPDRVIELCNLALEQFAKDPRDSGCKYETARAQQLRGNAKRRKKELLKSSGQ